MGEKIMNFFIEENIKKDLIILSKREGRTIKEIATELFTEYLKIHKAGNPQHLLNKFLENEDFVGFPSMAVTLEEKRSYLLSQCYDAENERLNTFGKQLWSHVTQWYYEMEKIA